MESPAWHFDDGSEVLIRPIRPEDEAMMARFHSTLSERSVYLRYFHMMNLDSRVAHERLMRICSVDHEREMTMVAEREGEIVAVGRLNREPGAHEAEFALLISDAFHGHGLGTELLRRLLEVAREQKLIRVTADILPENQHMMRICKLLGFQLSYAVEDHVVKAELSLI